MTAVLLAPARLSLPLSTVDEYLDPDDQREHQWNNDDIVLRHGYLQSLILGERLVGKEGRRSWIHKRRASAPSAETRHKEKVFCVSLPETIVAPGLRSLSGPFVEKRKMAAAVVEDNIVSEMVPSSPPELSYSKSSKSSSSSLRSDSSDDDGSTTGKLSHFDDTSVEDVGRDSVEDRNLRPESRPTLKRPPLRSSTRSDWGQTPSPPMVLRENRYPKPNDAVNRILRDQSLNLPTGRGIRRGFKAPPSPSLLMNGTPRISSRSPSPSKPFIQNGICVSPQTLDSATPRLSADAWRLSADARSPSFNGNDLVPRRKSWQPSRKTAKEIEAEYNDDDEEVPDEAILENVPISPMPGQSRPSRSTTPSPQRSPQRRPSYTPHTNLHSANVPKNAKRPSGPTILSNGHYGSPRSPRHPRPQMLQHSATMPTFPGDPLSRKQRSKSWTEDLNDEARNISAALEEYADRLSMENRGSGTNSVSSSPSRPSLVKQRAKTTILDMPSVQRGSIMIDPLPVSKEKEAVLTRTRPSWLPPKCQKEERRHMKEWEQMMARAVENQKKRALKEKEAVEDKEELKDSIARIWDQHVLPNWDTVIAEPRTRELWWRGVTPKSRARVWQKAIGNELELSESSFEAALKRATGVEEKIAKMPSEERTKSQEATWFNAIARDVLTACPEMKAAEQRAPFQNALRDVLKAYAVYRSDVGYVYGTHLVAGILCLHMKPVDAFVVLANMLNRPLPLAFLVHDTAAMGRSYDLIFSTLKYKFTKLHDHLTSPSTGLKPEEYLDPMFRCLFAYNMSSEHVSRVWDIFVFEGDRALVRAAVAVLGKLEGKLYGTRDEILDIISWRNEKKWDLGSEEDFMRTVREAGKVDLKGETQNP